MGRERNLILTILGVLLAVGCGPGETEQPDAQVVDENTLRRWVTELASDEMGGRAPGTPGDRMVRQVLTAKLERMGYAPGGDGGGWEQPFEIVGVTSQLPETWTFTTGGGASRSYRFRAEWMGASGLQRPDVSIEDAEVVFVGYGIEAPEQEWDDFKGVDLHGKLLLVLNDDPDWDPELFAGERKLYYGRWTYKYESAARQGAAGAVIIHTTPSAGYPWAVVRTSWAGEQFELPAGEEPRIKLRAWITEQSARDLVGLAGHALDELIAAARSRDFRPVPLGVTTSIRFGATVRRTETANVIGLLEGSDPELAREMVVFSAHHDHLGTGEPDESGDRIYNGALDNGVAMAQALGVARILAGLPTRPRRSVMLLFAAAEEQGLLGSRYFAEHPLVPPGRIAANINFELGNVWGPTRDVTIFGMGKSDLEKRLARLALAQDRRVHGESDPRAGWYYRSDQFSFARIGVPSIWFKSGTDFIGRPPGWGEETYARWIETKYHRPGDEVGADWDYSGLLEDLHLAAVLGLDVANSEEMPAWYAGDEFDAVRREALAALD